MSNGVIAIDLAIRASDNRLYLALEGNSDPGTIITHDSSGSTEPWETVGPIGFTQYQASWLQIAVDKRDGSLWAAFFRPDNSLNIMQYK